MLKEAMNTINRAIKLIDDSEEIAGAFMSDFESAKKTYSQVVFLSMYNRAVAVREDLEKIKTPLLIADKMFPDLKEAIDFEIKKFKMMAYLHSDNVQCNEKKLDNGETIRVGNFEKMDQVVEFDNATLNGWRVGNEEA